MKGRMLAPFVPKAEERAEWELILAYLRRRTGRRLRWREGAQYSPPESRQNQNQGAELEFNDMA